MSEAAELEREAEAARARLSETADQLRARMSPGQMMDEVLNQFRNGEGSLMVANLQNQVRDNPMALALIGSGVAWLMMGNGAGTSDKAPSAPAPGSQPLAARPASYGLNPVAGGLSTSQTADNSVGSTTDDTGGGISDAAAAARDFVGETVEKVSDSANRLAHDAQTAGRDALGQVRDTTSDIGQQARKGFFDVLEREPLILGALGVAVGAAIGALLPSTEIERQHLGSTGAALKQKAGDLVDQGVTAAKDAASEVYQSARDEADRQGLLPGDEPIANKVGAVVRAATEAAGASTAAPKTDDPAAYRDDMSRV